MSERISQQPVDAQFNKNRQPRGPGGPGRGPGGGMSMSGEKARNFRATIKTLLNYLRPYRLHILTVLILSVISTVFSIFGPKIMRNATTRLFEGAVAKITHVPGAAIDFTYIGNIIFCLL